ncbi:MAG TPA: protein-disulfide reductase DsbD domain-containing protein [Bryobacteraceae bacterium]|jgi:hypothetical protein|nr:protein-disulfide reductase DsbD domain-containing protein [Bryobacteraceae bacterium]
MNISAKFRAFSKASRRQAIAVTGLLLLPLFCSAQQNKLAVSPVQPITVKRGATVAESLKVVVLSGFHVNSDKPRDEFLIPLKLTWTSGPLEVKSIRYPKPEDVKVGNQTLAVFTGTFEIQTEFAAPPQATPGSSTMAGKIRYQACNNIMCFRPATVDVRLPLSIE